MNEKQTNTDTKKVARPGFWKRFLVALLTTPRSHSDEQADYNDLIWIDHAGNVRNGPGDGKAASLIQ